jgi:hypothetical protein
MIEWVLREKIAKLALRGVFIFFIMFFFLLLLSSW